MKRIEIISTQLDGKRFIEGKISRVSLEEEKAELESIILRDLVTAQQEANELDQWIVRNYDLEDEYDLRQAVLETLI